MQMANGIQRLRRSNRFPYCEPRGYLPSPIDGPVKRLHARFFGEDFAKEFSLHPDMRNRIGRTSKTRRKCGELA